MEVLAGRQGHGPSIVVDRDQLVVDVPNGRTAIPLAELRALRLVTSNHAMLELETATTSVTIPPVFSVGAYTLDARIRAHAPHDETPDPLAEVPVLASWQASPRIRRIAGIAGGAALVVPIAIAAITTSSSVAVAIPFGLLAGVLLLGLAVVHRGAVILDRRGVFLERGGHTSFIAWPELDPASLEVRGLPVQTLELRALRRTATARLALNRALGLGFPLGEIARSAREIAHRHR